MAATSSFGERLRELRLAADVTLRQCAAQVGVSPTYLSRVETDDLPPPTEEKVRALAAVLKIEPDELLALAERLPSEALEAFQANPKEMATFLRTAKGLSGVELADLTRQAEALVKARRRR